MRNIRRSCRGCVIGSAAWAAARAALPRYAPRWESLDQRPTRNGSSTPSSAFSSTAVTYLVPGRGVKGQYAGCYWHPLTNKKDDNPSWQHHQRVRGTVFDYPNFAALFRQGTEGKIPEQKYAECRVKYNPLGQVGQRPRPGGQTVKQVFLRQKPDALYAISAGRPDRLKTRLEGRRLPLEIPALDPGEAPGRYAYALKIPEARRLPVT